MKCNICPRKCGARRDEGQVGVCGASDKIIVARVSLHMWEEPCISGEEGAGTVFFSGCSLGCIYCQNFEISRSNNSNDRVLKGAEYTVEELAEAYIKLQSEGANNINLVTPTHYSLEIIKSVKMAKEKGLIIPIIYNCSGYERVETLKALKDTVDIYLTDFKYMDDLLGKEFSNVDDYSHVAKMALKEMVSQKPQPVFDDRGMMTNGVIVRNLLLPGHVKNSKAIVDYVYNTYGNSVYLSVMNQYTPLPQVNEITPLNRKVTKREYNRLLEHIINIEAENVYIQEGDVATESFIPDF